MSESKPTWGPAPTAVRLESRPTVRVDGATLAYREQGDGEPVVLVHGSASDLRTWEQQVPAISESHRVIAYSRRYARPNEDIPLGTDDQRPPTSTTWSRSFERSMPSPPTSSATPGAPSSAS